VHPNLAQQACRFLKSILYDSSAQ
jgi:hypothetical protein